MRNLYTGIKRLPRMGLGIMLYRFNLILAEFWNEYAKRWRMSRRASETLGESGKTVVYVFPEGQGLVQRGGGTPSSDHFKAAQSKLTASNAPAAHNDFEQTLASLLLQYGILTPAQYEVALHDQQATGLSLIEILVSRKWLLGTGS